MVQCQQKPRGTWGGGGGEKTTKRPPPPPPPRGGAGGGGAAAAGALLWEGIHGMWNGEDRVAKGRGETKKHGLVVGMGDHQQNLVPTMWVANRLERRLGAEEVGGDVGAEAHAHQQGKHLRAHQVNERSDAPRGQGHHPFPFCVVG